MYRQRSRRWDGKHSCHEALPIKRRKQSSQTLEFAGTMFRDSIMAYHCYWFLEVGMINDQFVQNAALIHQKTRANHRTMPPCSAGSCPLAACSNVSILWQIHRIKIKYDRLSHQLINSITRAQTTSTSSWLAQVEGTRMWAVKTYIESENHWKPRPCWHSWRRGKYGWYFTESTGFLIYTLFSIPGPRFAYLVLGGILPSFAI